MNNADKPIYPQTEIKSSDVLGHELTSKVNHKGLSIREYASMLAMQSIIVNTERNGFAFSKPEKIVSKAIELADELLKQLETK